MAKSSVPGLDRVRDLFTSAERAVLESTAGKALVEASRKQLAATLAQARALRDKWRDLHTTQARSAKRAAGGAAGANARSREKTDMFSAAVERIQARLGELGLAPVAGRPAAKSATKAARRAGHRTTRAGVKGSLAATAAAMNRGRAAQVAPRAAAKPVAAASPAAARPAAPIAKRSASKKRRPAKQAAAVLGKADAQAVRFDVAQQRSAKASATAARLKLDGKLTRRGGHVLAAGKRRQAARDRRGR